LTFTSLERFLDELGCQLHAVPGSHVTFTHPSSGALIVLRFYQDEETVTPADLAIVRRVLAEFGVVARDEFENLLRKRALAG
jgi:predicted RNA binding protein YcfA (HicA-like mRNA interferase family)